MISIFNPFMTTQQNKNEDACDPKCLFYKLVSLKETHTNSFGPHATLDSALFLLSQKQLL